MKKVYTEEEFSQRPGLREYITQEKVTIRVKSLTIENLNGSDLTIHENKGSIQASEPKRLVNQKLIKY